MESLVPSLISSFTVSGYESALSHWPIEKVQVAELYTFMLDDVHRIRQLLDEPLGGKITSASSAMAEWSRAPRKIRIIADEIGGEFAQQGITIVALATHLPEVSDFEPEFAVPNSNATQALAFTLDFAHQLNLQHNHRIRTIEVTGGNRIYFPDGRKLVANWHDQKTLFRVLIDTLNEARKLCHHRDDTIRFALEMEPGQIFTLRDADALCDICESIIGANSALVGLNLDIAHWGFMGQKIAPPTGKYQKLTPHVFHSHISDHSIAHFGDLPLESVHTKDKFLEWLRYLKGLLNSKQPEPSQFDGFVSLEMEAAPSIGVVGSSCDKLIDWIKEVNEG